MHRRIINIETNFKSNVAQVYELMNFDSIILDFAISSVSDLDIKIKSAGVTNPAFSCQSTLRNLQNIRQNDSLQPKYNIMLNQCVVLLVSYFGSSVGEIFKSALSLKISDGMNEQLGKEEIKLSLSELYNLSKEDISELITIKKEISFQDMQSISRAFKEYIGISIEKDEDVNNIIVSQACRHIIVHSGAIVNTKMIKQIKNAKPQSIRPTFKEGEIIQFTSEEVRVVGESMQRYISRLISLIENS